MVILENIDIDIDKAILQDIDIDKIPNRFKFGISNRATRSPAHPRSLDLFQPEVGLLPGFHLDRAAVTE